MNIGDVIKNKRQKMNMTQAELAEKLNVTPQAVSRWEMGDSYPDIAMVPLLSEVLWASADELLGIIPAHKVWEESGQMYVRVEDLAHIRAFRWWRTPSVMCPQGEIPRAGMPSPII